MLGIVGLAFLVPLAASAAAALRSRTSSDAANLLSFRVPLLSWPFAGLSAVSALNFFIPLRFLRMYDGDYLASCLFIAGTVLCVLHWFRQAETGSMNPRQPWRAIAAGVVLGMATMLAFSAWMNWALTDMWLNSARWMRFPVILLACLPYAFAEEWALGAPGVGNWLAKIRRYLIFASLRLLVWLSILFALYVYADQQILLAVLIFYMGFFSLLVRLGADAVHRRTASPAGAAVFTAILMAWFIAAVFPLT
jgi:hypothetical protein